METITLGIKEMHHSAVKLEMLRRGSGPNHPVCYELNSVSTQFLLGAIIFIMVVFRDKSLYEVAKVK